MLALLLLLFCVCLRFHFGCSSFLLLLFRCFSFFIVLRFTASDCFANSKAVDCITPPTRFPLCFAFVHLLRFLRLIIFVSIFIIIILLTIFCFSVSFFHSSGHLALPRSTKSFVIARLHGHLTLNFRCRCWRSSHRDLQGLYKRSPKPASLFRKNVLRSEIGFINLLLDSCVCT